MKRENWKIVIKIALSLLPCHSSWRWRCLLMISRAAASRSMNAMVSRCGAIVPICSRPTDRKMHHCLCY